jgi:hypothetical protein
LYLPTSSSGPESDTITWKYTNNDAAPSSLIMSAKTWSLLKVSPPTAFGWYRMHLPAILPGPQSCLQTGHLPCHDHSSLVNALSKQFLHTATRREAFL